MISRKIYCTVYILVCLVSAFCFFSSPDRNKEASVSVPALSERTDISEGTAPASEDTLIISSQPKTEEPAQEKKGEDTLSLCAYVVQSGDTAESIAALFGLRPSTVIGSNNATAVAELISGTVLRIPNRDGFFVYVNEFDTIELFSQAYKCDKSDIIKANALADAALDGISELFIPEAVPMAVIETEANGEKAFSSVGEGGTGSFYSASLIYPVAAEITSPFGLRNDPFTGQERIHNGMDFPVKEGTAILASGSGRVVFADEMRGYGTTLVIDNGGGYSTLYAHCSALLAAADDFVKRGQPVALSGSTGRATGPHLHFEIRHNNIPVDPEFFLQK